MKFYFDAIAKSKTEYMSVLLKGVYLNSVQLTYTKVLSKLEFKKIDI